MTSADASVAPDVEVGLDATPLPMLDAGPPDAGFAPLACACDDDEGCPACIALVGRCCYDDATFGGTYAYVLANCESQPACKVCCKECQALSCEALIAMGGCPNRTE